MCSPFSPFVLQLLQLLLLLLVLQLVVPCSGESGSFLALAGRECVLLATDSLHCDSRRRGFLLSRRLRTVHRIGPACSGSGSSGGVLLGCVGPEVLAELLVDNVVQRLELHRETHTDRDRDSETHRDRETNHYDNGTDDDGNRNSCDVLGYEEEGEIGPEQLARLVSNRLYRLQFPLSSLLVGLARRRKGSRECDPQVRAKATGTSINSSDDVVMEKLKSGETASGESSTCRPFICSMDGLGAQTRSSNYAAVGTASAELLSICEAYYEEDLEVNELVELATHCLKLAFQRNVLSGGDVKIITMHKGRIYSKEIEFQDV